ncbi:MAG: alanine racemase [Treponema sp.]|jgi:alanine racemase|nr:alanine racemase [Treponema sp.]
MQATRAIVHLDRFLVNLRAVRERAGPQRHICVPVKADAYGHGAPAIARASAAAGAWLGVARVEEGAALRKEGINAPILLFSQPLFEEIPEIIENQLIPLVSDGEFAAKLDQAAGAAAVRLPVHLKIDTGMGRMGCPPGEAPAVAGKIAACAALEYAGTATHLAVADSAAPEDIAYTERQIACFNEALEAIRAAGLNPGIVHAANSGAVILHPGAWFDMVRPGIILYGYKAVEETDRKLPPLRVEPVMELRTNVVMIKQVKKGETISYGRTWSAPQDTELAVLPIGYADGLPRLASNKWQVIIGGAPYPLAGRVCMDQCMADLGPASGVRRWDEAVIFGGSAPSAAELAERVGTIPYEITCNISKRVPRIVTNGENPALRLETKTQK